MQCHPDKRGDDPEAAIQFHKITQAINVLSDANERKAYDEKYKAQLAHRLRVQQMDAKRQRDRLELAEREAAAAKKYKSNESVREREREIERLREVSFARMQAMEEQAVKEAAIRSKVVHSSVNGNIEDCTLKAKWKNSFAYNESSLKQLLPGLNRVVISSKGKSAMLIFDSVSQAVGFFNNFILYRETPLK